MSELPSSSDRPETTETTSSPPESSQESAKPRSLADLLRDDDAPETAHETAPEGAPPGKAPEGASKAKPPRELAELAERLGTKPENLYAIRVPMADGESLTIGELKDKVSAQGDLTLRELQWEEDRGRKEGDLIRAQQELQTLVAALPKDAIKPEVMEQVRARHEATLKRERALTLETIPEWRDEAKRTEELAGIVDHLKEYGFPASYLQSLTDHRTLRYIRENWRREQRVRKALEQVTRGTPPATAKSKPNGAARPPGKQAPARNQDRRSRLLALLE